MQLERSDNSIQHLSYCLNIHPAEYWTDVYANLRDHVLPVRAKLIDDNDPFGIGLRLSAESVRELNTPDEMQRFKTFLKDNHCYVFTINGFPYGPFHGTRVKEEVYLPDWLDAERLRYTNELADAFSQFLPAGMQGSISTVPGAFKARVRSDQNIELIADNMVKHAIHLEQLHQTTGASIVLALEPEPCCYLETIDESVAFFTQHLFSARAVTQVQAALQVDEQTATDCLRKRLTLCLDLCHAAVEFEDAHACVSKLQDANISVGKIQISSGLKVDSVDRESLSALEQFDDGVYLHQVVERLNGELNRYTDLSEAFSSLKTTDATDSREWRVHFHVPIFMQQLEHFSTTQSFIQETLKIHNESPISNHLEVETYTWDVLPANMKTESIDDAIVRELDWVRQALT